MFVVPVCGPVIIIAILTLCELVVFIGLTSTHPVYKKYGFSMLALILCKGMLSISLSMALIMTNACKIGIQ